jgi:hypothetical protein
MKPAAAACDGLEHDLVLSQGQFASSASPASRSGWTPGAGGACVNACGGPDAITPVCR